MYSPPIPQEHGNELLAVHSLIDFLTRCHRSLSLCIVTIRLL